jgi:hypothetical protein
MLKDLRALESGVNRERLGIRFLAVASFYY